MPSQMVKATLAAAALSSASNVLAQFLAAYRAGTPVAFDVAQFLRFVTLSFLTAPPNYLWQQVLERKFPAYERPAASPDGRDLEKQMAATDTTAPAGAGAEEQPLKLNWKNTWSKWFIDCITLGAIFNTVAFFVLMGILKRQPLAQIAANVRSETVPVIVAGYKIWPFASIVSFSCVPVEKRIVFLSFIGLLWGIYMSLVASRV
ncbi:hypothetical protein F4780DRAFT_748648 [Xylariomycetidae sp. FL0641]|nr:hypothetical protein F4780DRAFT_748648 [Xylariomycetidae sp. FL0641]